MYYNIYSAGTILVFTVQESLQASWTDVSQTGCSVTQRTTDRLAGFPPPPSGLVESQRHLPSRFSSTDDSPSGKSHYTLLSPPSAVSAGYATSHSSYLHAYNYSDMPMGVEKVSRSKVLPNEVRLM